MSLKLQNKADAPCWPGAILVVDRRFCRSPLFAGALLPELCPGLLLGKDWSTSSSDSSNMIFMGFPLPLHQAHLTGTVCQQQLMTWKLLGTGKDIYVACGIRE